MQRKFPAVGRKEMLRRNIAKIATSLEKRHRLRQESGEARYGEMTHKGRMQLFRKFTELTIRRNNRIKEILFTSNNFIFASRKLAAYSLGRFNNDRAGAVYFLNRILEDVSKANIRSNIQIEDLLGKIGPKKGIPIGSTEKYITEIRHEIDACRIVLEGTIESAIRLVNSQPN